VGVPPHEPILGFTSSRPLKCNSPHRIGRPWQFGQSGLALFVRERPGHIGSHAASPAMKSSKLLVVCLGIPTNVAMGLYPLSVVKTQDLNRIKYLAIGV